MSTSLASNSALGEVLTRQALQLRDRGKLRLAAHSRSARRVAFRHSVLGYTGLVGALGTTFVSKLPNTTIFFGGMATVADILFGLGLLTALAAGLATQGLTAKRQETHTDAALRLDRFVLELDRHILYVPVSTPKQLELMQTRLIEIERQMPADALLPSGAAPVPTS